MLLVTLSIITIVKLNNNKNIKLDNVSLKEEIQNLNGLAIMLEQDDGNYKESSSNSWPADMYFNEELSGCVDNLGNKIENALTYENGITNVETGDTSYCVLYFDKTTNLNYLCKNYENIDECENNENLENVNGIWDSTLEDDGYRYVGTNPDNYICFGTTDQEECMNDTDKYMYRIIGIFEDEEGNQHLKLIKKEALNSTYAWHGNIDINWEESNLYKGINGSYFLTNTTYSYMQNNTWLNKIIEWKYTATKTKSYESYKNNSIYGIYYYFNTGRTIYLHEMNRSGKINQICYYDSSTTADCSVGEWTKVSSKIGLMYASDYSISLGSDSIDLKEMDAARVLKTSWIHISNNDFDSSSTYEWTMSYEGIDKYDDYYAWSIRTAGNVGRDIVYSTYYIRPVFYLTENIKITSGKGSITEPFIIS